MAGDADRRRRSAARRVVVLARTSVPPCFSVMPMPSVMPDFSHHGRNAAVVARDTTFGAIFASSVGSAASGASAARVMVIGHRCPVSTCAAM